MYTVQARLAHQHDVKLTHGAVDPALQGAVVTYMVQDLVWVSNKIIQNVQTAGTTACCMLTQLQATQAVWQPT